jgi:diguanylate cyclase (GGDEF)-like protein
VLDTLTLRVAFGVVGVCVLVLFYGVTYRSTRSPYSGWWCLSLACFLLSAMLFLLNGTPVQVAANPLGNTVAVLGAGCVWAGARSLRGRTTSWSGLAAGPAVVLLVSLLDDPAGDVWTGGPAFLLGMGVLIGLSSWELVQLLREGVPSDDARGQYRFAVLAMAVASGGVGVYYLLRCVVFVAVGPEHPVFVAGFGSQATTLLTMLLLVVVTFSMSALSHEQQTSELRVRATRDGLTGTLNRAEFVRLAQQQVDDSRHPGTSALMVADLDNFKSLNDRFGHEAGDRALIAFADSCRDAVGDTGLVGRLGGDEFVLLTASSEVERVAKLVGESYGAVPQPDDLPGPTASFGVAVARTGDDVGSVIARADVALYKAKAAGRDCVTWHDGHTRRRAELLSP